MFIDIEYLSKDQNWQNGSTTYWFDVDGFTYGVVESGNDSQIVDCDSYPIDYNDYLLDDLSLVLIVTDEMRLDQLLENIYKSD